MNKQNQAESYANFHSAEQAVSEALRGNSGFFHYLKVVGRLESIKHERADVKKKEQKKSKNLKKVYCTGAEVNLFVHSLDIKRCVQVTPNMSLAQVCIMHNIDSAESWFTIAGKPVKMCVPLSAYSVCEGTCIVQHTRMCGGELLLPTYHHVRDCEQQLLFSHWQLQSSDSTESDFVESCMAALRAAQDTLSTDSQWIIDLFENFFQIVYWLRKCDSKKDYMVCTALAFKLLTGKGVTSSVWSAFKINNLQSDTFTESLRKARDLFNVSSKLTGDPIVGKIQQIYTYLLVQGVLSKLGLSLEPDEFKLLDSKARVQSKSHSCALSAIIDTALSICERLDAYRVTGEWRALLSGDASCTLWAEKADKLIALAPFTSNLEAHGTTYFTFISDLNDCVEKGEAICKYSKCNTGLESQHMRRKLQSLQMLKNVEVTRRASQKERKAPFGVLIHGGSSVAKSTFTKMLFYYYGKVHGLDVDDHYRYVRNPADEYWSNFDSSKWCIQMDDIAYLLSSKCSEADPTLKEMLNVINNVPYVPPQAALEDKGKTPVMARVVFATTNTPDLNATDYFACPLAVRRRLPYVIKVEPKNEYLHKNGKFIDPTLLKTTEGEFPDFWKITVQQLKHADYHGRDSATLETVETFTDVHKFLQHFAKASLKHEEIQNKSGVCDVAMKEIKVCRLCLQVGAHCECLQSAQAMTFFLAFIQVPCRYALSWLVGTIIDCALRFILIETFSTLHKLHRARWFYAKAASFLTKERELFYFTRINALRNSGFKFTIEKVLRAGLLVIHILAALKVAGAAMGVINTYGVNKIKEQHAREQAEKEKEADEVTEYDSEDCSWELQGNVLSTTEDQLAKEETNNVWYNSTLELSQFDMPRPSLSLSGCTPADVRDLFAANCVKLEIKSIDAAFATRTGGVFLKGQFLCVNRHAFKQGTRFAIKIINSTSSQGLGPNCTVYASRSEFHELEEVDIVVLQVLNVPPRKDILKYWNEHQLPVSRIVSVARATTGNVTYDEYFNVQLCENFPVESLDRKMDIYIGLTSRETRDGDCGALGVALTPKGPVIVGLHTLGHNRSAGFPHVTRHQLDQLCSTEYPNVNGGGEPMLSLQGECILTAPHHKSLFRYLPQGVANIYGSFTGFRPKPRSKVCATPLQAEMLEHFQIPLDHGKPNMSGWEPWHLNVKEMVVPHMDVDATVLKHCVTAFAQDIIKELDNQHGFDWRGELIELSDRAAINGLPGVKFVDRINVNSSMGHPWGKSKKGFLRAAPDERYPEGVDFEPEVWERVRQIEAVYKEGERAYPVYTAHLKDEVLPIAKILKKKVRMFTGAPVDVSMVARKKLLTFVRFVQKNKFIFEAAPGTAAQSIEWTRIYHYLTAHGTDRIVAGDYGKFDKRMIASFVISAFHVIVEIFRAAGYSEQELMEIMCIGYDVAFPLVNVNGDLVEFFGTNPSGHTLTVIINSLVNSLYMRYAYCQLNPDGPTCWDFKINVNLITYGDDNAFGVSRMCSWFHHTSVQTALASIGVEYTMADKESETVPFIDIDQCSFLKRSWRLEADLEAYACPLEMASIYKSLTMWVPSGTIDAYAQMVDVIRSANSEFFFHGREIFEEHHAFFKLILEQDPYCLYVSESTLPNWEQLCERFRQASRGI